MSFQDVFKNNSIVTKRSVLKEKHEINIQTVNTLMDLIPGDSKFLSISFGCTGSNGNEFHIFTEKVSIGFEFEDLENDEEWTQFDNFLKVVMPILKSVINKMNLDLLALVYDVEDEYLAEDFLPVYFKEFEVKNIEYITLKTRGIAVQADTSVLSADFVDKLYLECPECEEYYKVSDVVTSEHEH